MRLQWYTGVKTGTQRIIRIERKEQGEKKKNRRIGRPVVSPLIESEKEEAAYMLRHKTWVFGNIK